MFVLLVWEGMGASLLSKCLEGHIALCSEGHIELINTCIPVNITILVVQ